MLDGAAFNFIRTKFKNDIEIGVLGGGSDIPVQYDNGPSIDHRNVQLWLDFRITPGESSQASFGQKNRHRNLGLAVAGVYGRIENGDKDIMNIVDQIKPAFTAVKENAVTYRTPSIERIGNTNNLGAIEPNVWYLINVICPYYFDHIA